MISGRFSPANKTFCNYSRRFSSESRPKKWVSGTSAQSGYAIHVRCSRKYRTVDKLTIQKILKLNKTQKSEQQKYSKTKLPCFRRLLQHSTRKWRGYIITTLPSLQRAYKQNLNWLQWVAIVVVVVVLVVVVVVCLSMCVMYFVVESNQLNDDWFISARVLDRDDPHNVWSVFRVGVHSVRVRHDKARIGFQQLQQAAPSFYTTMLLVLAWRNLALPCVRKTDLFTV